MNTLLQIGLGLSLSFIVVWIIIIKRKVFRIKVLLGALILSAGCAGAVTMGVMEQKETKKEEKTLSPKQLLGFANALLTSGEYDEVMKLVQSYSEIFGYDEECSYIVAKQKAMQGNYTEAKGIYARLAEDKSFSKKTRDEYELILKKAGADSSHLAMMDFLTENGKRPEEYGYTDDYVKNMEKALSITDEKIAGIILENMADSYDVDEFEDALEAISTINEMYENCSGKRYYSLGEEEQNSLEECLRELRKLEKKNDALLQTEIIQKTILKATLLKGDFKDLVKGVSRDSGYEELLIASELYMNGIVKGKDFADDFVGDYSENFERVAEQLENNLVKLEDELSNIEIVELENMVDTLKKAQKDPVLYVLREQLNNEGRHEFSAASEIDLGISKIEFFYKNKGMAKDYFYDAVMNGRNSDNTEYARIMSKIEEIVVRDDSSEITYLSEYVEQAIENALPVNCYGIISSKAVYESDENQNKEDKKDSYVQVMTDYVSEIKSSIAIGQIDTSSFETVKVRLTISSKYAKNSEELKQQLMVYDCGAEITEFEVEKVDFSSLKTMLICDVSGSMNVCMEDLRNAVNNYVENMHSEEQVSIVTFSNGIEGSTEFTQDKDILRAFSDSMHVCGGTEIYNTLYYCLSNYESEITSNDTIILMTDGQDNNPQDTNTIIREIGSLAVGKGVTVYTIGLGSVDATYLSTLASSGNGKLVYVSDSESLTEFYELLQSQVDNQYIITYKAKDTLLTKNRSIEVKLKEENIQDFKEYSLYTQEETGAGEEALPAGTLSVIGLDINSVQKSKQDIEVHLIGTGFSASDSAKMKLLGDMDYDVSLEYVDENRYKAWIPSSAAVGTYDLQISINDKTAYIENGFTLYEEGDTKVTKFGPYTFTSLGKTGSKEKTILSGNVTLNGWLYFRGDVVLEGDLENGNSVRMTEETGSYVTFDPSTATGVGTYFAKKGIPFSVPRLGSFYLYNDPSHIFDYDNYQVDSIRTTSLKIINLLYLESPVIKLYPNNIKLEYTQGSTILPFQDEIFKAVGVDCPFAFKLNSSAVLTNQNVGIIFEFEGEDNRENFRQFNVLNAPVYLDMNELKISVNTIDQKYSFGGLVKIAFLDLGLGAEVSLNGFQLDGFLLTIDKDLTVMLGEVPLTFSKFRVGAEEIATAVENKNFGNVTFVGQMDMAVAKVGAYFPKLKDFVGDMSLVSLSDATIKFRWSPIMLSTSSEVKIFDEFTLAKSSFSMGNYSYTNALLGLENRDVQGFNCSITEGFMWDIDNCHINISGTGELSGNSRFIGLQYEGVAELDVQWWILSKSFDKSGTALIGVYYTEYGEPQFTLALAYQGVFGKNKKLYYYIDSHGNVGDKNGTL